MERRIIRTTMTITIEEEIRCSSSSFPAAASVVVETTAEPRPSDHPPRPLAKAVPRDGARRAV